MPLASPDIQVAPNPPDKIKNIADQRHVFAPSITDQEKSNFLELQRRPLWMGNPDINPAHHPGLKDETIKQLEVIGSKLAEIGIENPSSLLPQLAQIKFKEGDNSPWTGFCDLFGREFAIYVPRNSTFPNSRFRKTLSHESAHFMKKYVMAKRGSEGKVTLVGAGFVRYDKHINDPFEEANAELFSLFCSDDGEAQVTSYGERVTFMIALLKKFAEAKSIEPVEAFKKLFKANATRDFSFQREMVEVFGKDAVRALNNLRWWESETPTNRNKSESEMTPERIAELGGFQEGYTTLKTAFNQGQEISLPGMKGSFIKQV